MAKMPWAATVDSGLGIKICDCELLLVLMERASPGTPNYFSALKHRISLSN